MKKILGILSIMFLLVSCDSRQINVSEGNGVAHDEKIEIVRHPKQIVKIKINSKLNKNDMMSIINADAKNPHT